MEVGKRGIRRNGNQSDDESNERPRFTHERPETRRLVEFGMHWRFAGRRGRGKVDLWLGWCVFTWGGTCFGIARQLTKTRSKSDRHV